MYIIPIYQYNYVIVKISTILFYFKNASEPAAQPALATALGGMITSAPSARIGYSCACTIRHTGLSSVRYS